MHRYVLALDFRELRSNPASVAADCHLALCVIGDVLLLWPSIASLYDENNYLS